jgi:hemerythrin-like domain-containing protein
VKEQRGTADKVQTQHQLLKSQLSGALRAAEDEQGPEAAGRVERLARSLELHLRLEEEHYFPQARAAQPLLGDGIDELVLEHTELRRILREAVELLSRGDMKAGSAALGRYETIFRDHEQREFDLLEDRSANPTSPEAK